MQNREIVEFGPFRMQPSERLVERDGSAIPLTPKVFDLLLYFTQNPSRLIPREELLKHLWPDSFVEESNLTVYVSTLRKALGDSWIQTVPKQGYRFTAEVRRTVSEISDPLPDSVEPGAADQVPRRVAEEPEQARWGRGWVYGAVAIGALAFAGGWWMTRPRIPPQDMLLKAVPVATDPALEFDPTLSPEGTRVAYAAANELEGRFAIFVKQIPGGNPTRVSPEQHDARKPAWSPDGNWIAYLAKTGRVTRDLMITQAGGGAFRKLGELRYVRDPHPLGPALSWAPDNRWILISESDGSSEATHIAAISVETGEKKLLTTPEPGTMGDGQPSISPDGRTLVFSRSVTNTVGDFYALPLEAGEMRATGSPSRLTFLGEMIGGSAWTPDGRGIVITAGSYSSTYLMRVAVEPGFARREPEPVRFSSDDALSPSASRGIGQTPGRLVYQKYIDDVNLWRLPLDQGRNAAGAHQAWAASTRMEATPSISPDGSRVAFASTRSGSWEIWVCLASGSHCGQVTSFGRSFTWNPKWSPDGGLLAFDSRAAGSSDVYVIRPDGGGLKRITSDAGNEFSPVWSRDGKSLYFSSNRTGNNEIWQIPAGGGPARQITKGGGDLGFETRDGRSLIYSAHGRELRQMHLGAQPDGVRDAEKSADFEQLVTGTAIVRGWAVEGDGLYFIPDRETLQYMDLTTRKVSTILQLDNFDLNGMAVSPDRKWILFLRRDRLTSDLYLVDGFH